MKEKLTLAYIKGKCAFLNAVDRFKSEERGASEIVAVILLIVVIIAVAAIFREQLTAAVTNVFGKLNEAINGGGGE